MPVTEQRPADRQMGGTPGMSKHAFRVMGCDAELIVRADETLAEPLFEVIEEQLRALEARLTRFQPTSELSILNDRRSMKVSPEMLELLRQARGAWRVTGGRFDIGVGADVIAQGYDRTFSELNAPAESDREQIVRAQHAGMQTFVTPPKPSPIGASGPIPAFRIDRDGTVTVRPGIRLDLGGIAKGWCADRMCQSLAAVGASCLVNLGGDIAVFVAEGDEPWPVGVRLGEGGMSLGVAYGGIATSGQDRRTWKVDGSDELAHHVIDPRTGRSARTDVLRITVVEASAMRAEVWTKALMLRGCDGAAQEAEERGLATIIVGVDGSVRATGALRGIL